MLSTSGFGTAAILLVHLAWTNGQLWIDCHPNPGATEDRCKERDCVWEHKSIAGAPPCTFSNTDDPSKMAGYDAKKETGGSALFKGSLQRRSTASLFGDDFPEAKVTLELVTNDILRVQITEPFGETRPARYPEWRENLKDSKVDRKASTEATLDARVDLTPFGLAVVRKSTNTTLLDTRRVPGLTFAKQYLQISTRIPTQYVYGLGETTRKQLKHDFNFRKWGLFSRDYGPGFDDTNLYGVHPFYVCLEDDDGNAHGVFFSNTHAMNVVLQPDPSNPNGGIITWRAIGGALELFVFSGPTPDHVMTQYTSIIGRPQFPPYWSLGFQLSRWGYPNANAVEDTVDRNREAGIPQDTQVIDIDYMNAYMDFSYDPVAYDNFSTLADKLHKQNKKLVLILDPAIPSEPKVAPYAPLDSGLAADVFIKDNRTGEPLQGAVWPGKTYYPDFTNPETLTWWAAMIKEFYEKGVKFDGLWIDMNEPSNFLNGSSTGCQQNSYNNPPYNPLIYGCIYEKTICLDSDQQEGKHYELHNLYGYTEAMATYNALQEVHSGKRPFVLSRSTFAGSGKYTNHWTGDNTSLWPHMKMSIISILEFSLFGIPFVGSDICGFNGQATEEMCIRWSQLGSFYPFSRNHNALGNREQDPAAWSLNATAIIRDAIVGRYRYLPYLYSILHQSHATGIPVARPLFFDFPNDKEARIVDNQFLFGPALMIAPILEAGATNRQVYFPRGAWYDMLHSHAIPDSDRPRQLTIDMPIDVIGVYLRGGHIVPWQVPALTTAESRRNDLGLFVGLDEEHQAKGVLYWDDGESENAIYSLFAMDAWNEQKRGGIRIRLEKKDYPVDALFTSVTVYGMREKPISVTLDGTHLSPQLAIEWNEQVHTLNLRSFKAKMNVQHDIVWEFADGTTPAHPPTAITGNPTTVPTGTGSIVGMKKVIAAMCLFVALAVL